MRGINCGLWPGFRFVVACSVLLLGEAVLSANPSHQTQSATEEWQEFHGEVGRPGGRLVVALRAEPKTLNPVFASDAPSREVISTMQSDLIHINRATQLTELALAKSWKVSPDGLRYTLTLRKGLRFSDGHPLDADDVLFTFHVYLDEKVNAPQRDLLVVGGKPIMVRALNRETVLFELAQPYGVGERLFDGFPILPRHLLEKAYEEGRLNQLGTLSTAAAQWAGLGPFRFKEYVPGQRLVLERNPYYWKSDAQGHRLPYLDELTFVFVSNADSQVLSFQSGDSDVIARVGAQNFSVLLREQRDSTMVDAGPGLEYNFLFFNLNDLGNKTDPDLARKRKWFRDVKFRQAVSAAIDRDAIVDLVYAGRGSALWGPVTPGNHRWIDSAIGHPPRSLDKARQLLREAGFRWTDEGDDGPLVDADGNRVQFSLVTSSSNADRLKMATLIQADLKQLGMQVQLVPLEFRSLLDRLMQSKQYDACVLGIASFDSDPNSDLNVWLSSGGMHLWNPLQAHPSTSWETEIDQLMRAQLTATNYQQRKKMFDRVQEILTEYQPMIFLASPDILAGAKTVIGNFHPAVLEPYILWNVEQLYRRSGVEDASR